MKAILPLTCAGLMGLWGAGAAAQTAPGDPAGNQTIPEKDRSLSNPPSLDPGSSGEMQQGRSLSDKLDKGNGVIKPAPGVDPGMVKPAPVPNPQSMPVIPPAGTPAGPPGPEPK